MRRLIVLCSAAGAVAMAAPACAEGPYLAAEGGIYKQQHLGYDFVGLSDFFATKYSTGYDVAGKLGYDFEGIRVELELGYKQANLNRFGFQIGDQSFAVQSGKAVTGNFHTISAMANGYWDITQKRFHPYVGAGVGFVRVTSDKVGYSNLGDVGIFLNRSDYAFAFQLMAGMKARINDHISANLGYRYFDVETVKLNVFHTTATASLRSSSILLGVSYTFGHPRWGDARPALPIPPAAATPLPPAPPPPPETDPVQTDFSLAFPLGSAALPQEATMSLDRIATTYRKVDHISIMLSGVVQTDGPAVYDDRLSQRRAFVTKAYLVGKGVPKTAIGIQSLENPGAPDPAVQAKSVVSDVPITIGFGPGSGQ